MKIAQISDIHISADGRLVDGVDTRASFTWALDEAVRTRCDRVVLSGDLAATKHDWAAYPWIAAQLAALPMPSHVMAGNHDGTPEVVEAFGLRDDYVNGALCFESTHDDVALYGLDTSRVELPPEQLEWLRARHARTRGLTPLVFMHHPPLVCGCRFMDAHEPLEDREQVWQRIAQLRAFEHVFCGHYHTYKVVERDGVRVVLCPSTLLQIPQDSPGFAIEHTRPGYLEISASKGDVSWRAVYRAH